MALALTPHNRTSPLAHSRALPQRGRLSTCTLPMGVVTKRPFGLQRLRRGPDPGRLQLLYDSGLLAPLQRQLSDRGDPLAALAALQLVEEHLATATTAAATAAANGSIPYGTSSGSGSGGDGGTTAVAALLLPQLLSLLSDPAVADAAMPVVAGIVRHSLPYALPAAAVAAALASSNGAAGPHAAAPPHPATVAGGPGLAAAPALLAAVRRVLDERGDASAAAEACGLDAAGSLGLSRAGAQLVLADAELTNVSVLDKFGDMGIVSRG